MQVAKACVGSNVQGTAGLGGRSKTAAAAQQRKSSGGRPRAVIGFSCFPGLQFMNS